MKTFQKCAFCAKCSILERFHELKALILTTINQISVKKKFDFKGGGCFAKLQMHNGSRPLSFFKIDALNSAYKNLPFYHYCFIKKTFFRKLTCPTPIYKRYLIFLHIPSSLVNGFTSRISKHVIGSTSRISRPTCQQLRI